MRVSPEYLTFLLFMFWPPIAIAVAGYVVLRVSGNTGRHPVAVAIGYGLVAFAAVMGLVNFLALLIGQI